MPAPPDFIQQVRHALAHLYDPDVLRNHPLLAPFGLHERANPQAALRDRLLEAIDELKPAPSVPVDSRAWRVYVVLHCRYVQQLDQEQTAHQLGVGVRHIRREQHVAIEALADALYQKIAGEAQNAGRTGPTSTRLEDELSWLKTSGQAEVAAVAEVLTATLKLVTPLATMKETRLETSSLPPLPPVALHPAVLRQALVSTATYAIRRVPGGAVRFSAQQQGRRVLLSIAASASSGLTPAAGEEKASLEAARSLLRLDGGRLDAAEDATTLSLTVAAPVAGAVDILLIDDNSDFAQLFSRYVAGTRFRLQCLNNAQRLFDVLAEHTPQIIVLDVMMPGLDGWEVLGRLRQHPLTSTLPIIVCTILPERELALALGATGFLAKPVTRQALLAALHQAMGE